MTKQQASKAKPSHFHCPSYCASPVQIFRRTSLAAAAPAILDFHSLCAQLASQAVVTVSTWSTQASSPSFPTTLMWSGLPNNTSSSRFDNSASLLTSLKSEILLFEMNSTYPRQLHPTLSGWVMAMTLSVVSFSIPAKLLIKLYEIHSCSSLALQHHSQRSRAAIPNFM